MYIAGRVSKLGHLLRILIQYIELLVGKRNPVNPKYKSNPYKNNRQKRMYFNENP